MICVDYGVVSSDWSEVLGCGWLGMRITRGVKPVDMEGLRRYGGVVVGACGRNLVEIR